MDKSPEEFINKVRELVDSSGIEVEVYDQKWLEENDFGGVLGVGKGLIGLHIFWLANTIQKQNIKYL